MWERRERGVRWERWLKLVISTKIPPPPPRLINVICEPALSMQWTHVRTFRELLLTSWEIFSNGWLYRLSLLIDVRTKRKDRMTLPTSGNDADLHSLFQKGPWKLAEERYFIVLSEEVCLSFVSAVTSSILIEVGGLCRVRIRPEMLLPSDGK